MICGGFEHPRAMATTPKVDPAMSIVDCHVHFIDAGQFRYPIFPERSAGFEALVGDYSALPRRYLPADYLADAAGLHIDGTVCAEFMSSTPFEELRWAQSLADLSGHPSGTIACVDFRDPDVEHTIEAYRALGRVRAVRQHLAWHPTSDLLRFAQAPDLLDDVDWRRGLASLRIHDLACEIEIFATQLADLTRVARNFPDLRFILPMMGWPIDLTEQGFRAWRSDMAGLARCENVAVKIFGAECIFGLNWTVPQIRPWVLTTIELFGPTRCMFASLMPIAALSRPMQDVYRAYEEIVEGFTPSERRHLFHDTAKSNYRV
jgi:predicted TIM-barrel fold metal-dependent hydrolase